MPAPVPEAHADRLARNVLRSRLGLKPKEKVVIETYPSSLPWANGFVREARRAGALPILHYEDEKSYWTAVEEGQAGLLGASAEHELAALSEADGRVQLAVVRDRPKAWRPGARMGIARATPPNARTFGVSYAAWRAGLFAASTRDIRPLVRQAERLRKILERGGPARLSHPNGTDLSFALAQRPMREGLGRVTPAELRTRFGMMASVPEALVYLSVDESTADGTVVANRPTRQGASPREGGRWVLKRDLADETSPHSSRSDSTPTSA
jgi:leucyl aminopeptidase (aminopeptidase T)